MNLTPEILKANALAAYRAGTLIAQAPNARQEAGCLISEDGCRTCGTGASFPQAHRLAYRGHSGLIPRKVFGPIDAPTRQAAIDLANLHDRWCCDSSPEAEARFLAFVQEPS
jgi:hypothetical protein